MPRGGRHKRAQQGEIRIDWNGLTDAVIGNETGVSEAELAALAPRLATAITRLQSERAQGMVPFLDLPGQRGGLQRTLATLEQLRPDCDCLVMLGVGGSATGARALAGALAPAAGRVGKGGTELLVVDHIDPYAFSELLDRLDLRRTVFNVVTKSGETAETLAQFLVVRDRLLREFGAAEYARHLLITTDAASGALRQIVNDEGLLATEYPAAVGGRFSILSPVHLAPAALLEIAADEILDGAAAMDVRCREPDPERNPAGLLAGIRYLLDALHGVQTAVLMPYSERLVALAHWWAQLWAESLGKRVERNGAVVSIGQTPVIAVGAADQHSQIQLFLEGPADKLVAFLAVDDHGARVEVPRSYRDIADVAYLGGQTLGELLNAEQQATAFALAKHRRPTLTISLPAITPYTIGQLTYLMEVEAVLFGSLMGIDPYGQPGIEEVKRLTFGVGGKPGYEQERAEVESAQRAKQPRFML
jgi:glucose-6-phosphate isomerase